MSRASTPPDLLALPPRTLASSASTPGRVMMEGGRQETRGEGQEAGVAASLGRGDAGSRGQADGHGQHPGGPHPECGRRLRCTRVPCARLSSLFHLSDPTCC